MFSKIDYAMINVADMARAVAFYRDVLGIAVKIESPGWSEFQTGTTTLALHLAAPGAGGAFAATVGPVAGTCSIGFSVENLDATCSELQSRGARFVMLPTVQAEEGIKLAVCVDPDGLAISFAETLPR
jgi:lactoylglutathione lyase